MTRRLLLASVLAGLLLLAGTTAALATFTDGTSASHSIATDTLAAPTSPVAGAGTCTISITDRIDLSWATTTSTWADGYEIARSTTPGGPYSVVGTVAGHATTAWTDATVSWTTTYYYVVRATKHAWTSADTAETSHTTLGALCI